MASDFVRGLPGLPLPTPEPFDEKPGEAGPVVVEKKGWQEVDEVMADFRFSDLAGRSWTRVDFEGQATWVNFWATWCLPCLAELPYVQELRGVEAMAVVTFNVDENLGLIERGGGFMILSRSPDQRR